MYFLKALKGLRRISSVYYFCSFYFCLCWVFVASHSFFLVVMREAASRSGAWASHSSGFSCCGAQALGVWVLWHMGWVALLHVESSQIRNRTHVTYSGWRILIHCTTREVQEFLSNPSIELIVLKIMNGMQFCELNRVHLTFSK